MNERIDTTRNVLRHLHRREYLAHELRLDDAEDRLEALQRAIREVTAALKEVPHVV